MPADPYFTFEEFQLDPKAAYVAFKSLLGEREALRLVCRTHAAQIKEMQELIVQFEEQAIAIASMKQSIRLLEQMIFEKNNGQVMLSADGIFTLGKVKNEAPDYSIVDIKELRKK